MRYPVILIVPFLRVEAIAIFPFVFIKHKALKNDAVLIRHEHIHLRQEVELLIIPFYLLYLINYLVNLARFKNHYKAYRHIVFELEAYACEGDHLYLKQRQVWAWLSFLHI